MMNRIGIVALTAALILSTKSFALADDALPSGKDVLARYIEVTGGRAAYEKVHSRVTTATLDLPEMNLKGSVVTTQAPPNRGNIVTKLPGIGVFEQGTDGTIAWDKNVVTGPRILEGPERDTVIRSLTINNELDPEKHYKSIETTGVENVDGKPAYKVVLTGPGGKETRYYDKESGLLVKMEQTSQTQMGEITAIIIPSDYREVDGIKMPFKATQEAMGRKVNMTMDKIEHNVDVPDSQLAMPDDVKALLEKKKSAPSSAPATNPG